jgi:hypothetical protein
MPFSGKAPFEDFPYDQEQIKRGIQYYRCYIFARYTK